MHAALLAAAEEHAEAAAHLPFPPAVVGLVAFGVLMVMLATTFAFRSVGTRH